MAEAQRRSVATPAATPTQTTSLARPEQTYPTQVLPPNSGGHTATISEAPFGAVMGKPGGLTKLALATGIRAGLIGLGCYVAGIRGKPLVLGSLAASTTLSLMLVGHHAIRSRRTW